MLLIWEWSFFDHGIQDFDSGKPNYVGAGKTIANYPGRINLNLPGRPVQRDWLHCISLDYSTNLDQIVIAAEGGEFYVINHGATFVAGDPAASIALAASTNGDFIYRFGDPARHGQGNPPSINANWTTSTTGNKQIGGVGRVGWIPVGLPGAGRFLAFNSGQDLFETTPQSYLFEINGYLNSSTNDTGAYVHPPTAGYNTWVPAGHDTDKRNKLLSKQVVWTYYSMANQGFFSHTGGSAQRLPNGNTLICSAAEGHIFEVTSAGDVVWEYVNPVSSDGVGAYRRDEWPTYNAVSRATRYAATHPALAGHTLTGVATVAGAAPSYISAPYITGTSNTPVAPTSSNTVWVTANVTNNGTVAAVTLTRIVGASTNASTMYDDGLHGDGAAGDGRFGAQIPAFAAGTLVKYYVSAKDDFDNVATDPAGSPGTAYSYTVVGGNAVPAIYGVTNSAAYSGSPVWVTAHVTDDVSVATVTLTYDTGSGGGGGGQTNTVFLETMRAAPVKPWTGDGCDNPWTVTYTGGNPFEQRTGANYGAGNTNGLEFKNGTANLGDSMIAPTATMDSRGASGYAEFYVSANSQSGTAGWTFQVNGGTGFVTRVSELTGSNHNWQLYHYDLQPSEMVSNMAIRFQFSGGLSTNRIDLDQIAVKVVAGGSGTTNVVMLDDGAHGDGLAGDGIYGAQIPGRDVGSSVSYYVTATDGGGLSASSPAGAPGTTYSYSVGYAASHWSMAKLPDTGQTLSYTATFGEDSDYTINPPAYTNNGNGTISDEVTGLMWQQTDGGEMTWEAAKAYATNLNLGGHTDWRLPTAHEAFSILTQRHGNPAVDTNYFTVTTAEYWWTTDTRKDNTNYIWASNWGGGIGAHPKTETLSAGGTKRFHVRCVRGAAAPTANPTLHHLTNLTVNSVTDLDTGLTWQRVPLATQTNWEAALQYAESLSLDGYTDWRLPNIKELRSINDETLAGPSVDTNYFTGAPVGTYWSSTTLFNVTNDAWYADLQYGLTTHTNKAAAFYVRCVRGGMTNASQAFASEFARIPAGQYQMGDHFGFVDPLHPSDEVPVHTVYLDAFYMSKTHLTCREYCDYLNSALAQGLIEVRSNYVYAVGGTNIYSDTSASDSASRIEWSGTNFSVRESRDIHPITGVRWFGAIAYCNWASARDGLGPCYNLESGACVLTNNGYRLPTEAEWEYAARGGLYSPYAMFPWGNDTNASGTLANWAGSGDPYETGSYPNTTPVAFYNGQLHTKAEYGWPGTNDTYQTQNNLNGFGLYDMSGNVWQWINDWYLNDYYTNCVINNVVTNPPGPLAGSTMPDGNPYRGLRGGNWFNGQDQYGHGRAANRNPSYFRGPGDPDGPWFHIGFRVMRALPGVVAPGGTLTQLATGFGFAEGPAADATGAIYFSDITADRIHFWSLSGQLSTFRTNSGGANGLYVDAYGDLIACEGDNGRLVSISPQTTNAAAIASTYGGQRFNEPNDLWIDPSGGVYFTDPIFFGHTNIQNGQHVYYLKPDRSAVIPVVSDMVRPNGLIGTPDGETLYIADWGAGAVYRYGINADGTLANKALFASVTCDGMTIDIEGNVYLTENAVLVYNRNGQKVDEIAVPERPTNVEFGGSDRGTLFITTETSLYSIRMSVQGNAASTPVNRSPMITGVTNSPAPPLSGSPVWITARVTDDVAVASVTLSYGTGAGGVAGTNTAFLETMRTGAVKPWTGDGCDNPWTVTFTGGNPFEQRAGANYGTGNTNGLEFKSGTVNLTNSMITTTGTIDARGDAGFVEFYLQALTLSNGLGNAGWTFQLDGGTGFVTRLSELTSTNHGWKAYRYDLDPSELVSNLAIRFQFRGGATENRMDLDLISLKTLTSGSSWTNVAMLDDGAHGDGAAGDGVYGAQIPAQSAGTTVSYYIMATDGSGASSTNPTGAPGTTSSYTVQSAATARTVGLVTNTASAYPGYTLMAPMHYTNTYLINNAGEYVHMWTSAYEPGRAAFLLENGHMIRACMIKQGGPSTGGGEGGRIEEHDWSGNLVWAIDYYSPTYIHHHDFKVLPNGNVLLLVAEKKTAAEVLAAGFNPALLDSTVTTNGGFMLPDCLVEIKPTRPYGGTVVWEWHMWDHMIQDYDNTKNNYGVVANHPELIDANGTGMRIPQFWNHVNGIDYNAALDQIIISVRGNSELFVIDHQLTTAEAAGHTGGRYGKGGDILYRWGWAAQYDRGGASPRMLWQQHHTHWIEEGLPGAGHILIFNNGIGRGYSTIDEIVPPVDAAGNYALNAGAAYGPVSNYWSYVSSPTTNFYSAEISGAQRLPNGNTLICSGIQGILFEVSTTGQTVWRYVCPVTTEVMTQGDAIPIDQARPDQLMNAVFRVNRYPTNFVGLAGKDLTPRGPIEIYPEAPADTDGDGMSDAWEISHFGSLMAAGVLTDHEGDDVTDRNEYRFGLHPNLADTDTDGLPDGWEIRNSFDPAYAADVNGDADGDLSCNLDEYTADTNPRNRASYLRIQSINVETDGVELVWIGGTGAWQYAEYRLDIGSTNSPWVPFYTNAPPTAVTNGVIHDGAQTEKRMFYRVRVRR